MLSTRKNLGRHCILHVVSGMDYAVCLGQVESIDHLFTRYVVASTISYKVFKLLRRTMPIAQSVLCVFELVQGLGHDKMKTLGLTSI